MKIVWIIIAILVAIGLVSAGLYYYQRSQDEQESSVIEEPPTATEPSNDAVDNGDPDAPANAVNITIAEFRFQPQNITVERGTTVVWTNQDTVGHNVVASDENNTGGLPTTAPLLEQGESFQFTFNEIGTFDYLCEPHPTMIGTVTVVDEL